VTKLQALAARQVSGELKLRSVWSWGWGVWSVGETDEDKPAAACVYLWARNPKLCDGPAAGGTGFNASRTEGQLVLPPGARCTLYGRQLEQAAIDALAPVTGDSDVAFSAVFARAITSVNAPLKSKQVRDAEKAVIAGRFGGSVGRYRAALAAAHASPAAARGAVADELRRAAIQSRMRVAPPSSSDAQEYYETYGGGDARLVETKAPAPWLGKRKRGYALESNAPPQLFTIPEGQWRQVRTMRGTFEVRAVEPAVSLGAIPFELARPAIRNALVELAKNDTFERWLLSRQRAFVEQALCRKDVQPEAGIVPLTDYLPFLAAD
jgi:hypothetical protein